MTNGDGQVILRPNFSIVYIGRMFSLLPLSTITFNTTLSTIVASHSIALMSKDLSSGCTLVTIRVFTHLFLLATCIPSFSVFLTQSELSKNWPKVHFPLVSKGRHASHKLHALPLSLPPYPSEFLSPYSRSFSLS